MNVIWMIVGLTVIGLLLIAVDFYLPGFVLGSIGIVLMLIAVALFDGVAMLSGRNTPETMLPMSARVGGFVLGALLMWAIPLISGSPVTLY